MKKSFIMAFVLLVLTTLGLAFLVVRMAQTGRLCEERNLAADRANERLNTTIREVVEATVREYRYETLVLPDPPAELAVCRAGSHYEGGAR